MAQQVKKPPALQETWVRFPGQEDAGEATTPIFLPGRANRQRSLAGYSPWSHKESDTTEQLSTQVNFTKNNVLACLSLGTRSKHKLCLSPGAVHNSGKEIQSGYPQSFLRSKYTTFFHI